MRKYYLKHKSLFAISLLLGTIFSIGSSLMALIMREVIDSSTSGDLGRFYSIAVGTVVYFMALGISYGLYGVFSKKLICRIIKILRQDIFSGIFRKNISDFHSVNSADYLSALTNDVKNLEDNYFSPLLLCLQNIIIFIVSFAIMLYLSPLVLLSLFAALILLLVIPGLFQGALQKRQDAFSKKQSLFTVGIKDVLSGFEVIRSYHMNGHVEQAFEEKNSGIYQSKYSLEKIMAAVEAVSTVLGTVLQFSVMFVSAYLIITGKISAGSLVGLVQASGTIVMPIQVLSQNIPKIRGCKPIMERLLGFTDCKDSAFSGTQSPSFQNGITLKNVHFGYTAEQEIIKGLDFTFHRGKKYALVGKSGCGKTTLINLLTGYYSGFGGEVLYDGVDLHALDLEKLNELSSVIHQNVYMFDESIRDNICLHKRTGDRDLAHALEISGVSMFLDGDKTLDSMVGENGNYLSGGQRQRIAVARALVQGKPLLILDEGTSAVDMQTAYDIEDQLLKNRDLTLITITHSMNEELLGGYDRILYMADGRIAESGSFEELLALRAGFHDFYSITNKGV